MQRISMMDLEWNIGLQETKAIAYGNKGIASRVAVLVRILRRSQNRPCKARKGNCHSSFNGLHRNPR